MNKEFIPYEQALALKELGFDEPCFGSYQLIENRNYENGLKISHIMGLNTLNGIRNHNYRDEITNAPLLSQAFRWFREKYNLMFQIFYLRNGNYAVLIHRTTPEYMDLVDQINSSGCVDEVVDCYSYEEAELACLVKLIEIATKIKNSNTNNAPTYYN